MPHNKTPFAVIYFAANEEAYKAPHKATISISQHCIKFIAIGVSFAHVSTQLQPFYFEFTHPDEFKPTISVIGPYSNGRIHKHLFHSMEIFRANNF